MCRTFDCSPPRKKNYSTTDLSESSNKSSNQNHYFQIAICAAKKSCMNQKHGCVIVYKKQVVCTAYNTMPSTYKQSLHAEVNAIKKAKQMGYMLNECDLYIVRIGQTSMDFPLKYSKPCKRCAEYISENRIKKIFYSLDDIQDYTEKSLCNLTTISSTN